MAEFNSSQSGNFSSSATWGGAGVPGNGDRFDINNGHTVTIDSGISVPSTGYADSYIFSGGILQSQSGQDVTLRMNGRLYIKAGGTLHLRSGATVEINGSSGEQHGIWQENEDGASVIMEGTDGMPTTTLAAGTWNENATYFDVSSATNFAAGEWIAIFDNQTSAGDTNDSPTQHRDEGFWIHDIDSNRIYFRWFVGPEDVTVSSVNGSVITVSNAKKFREGQFIIFGTGANRNLKEIDTIDYASNDIRVHDSVNILQDPNYNASTWSAIFGGSFTTGQEDPYGGTNAVRYTGSPGTSVLLRITHNAFTPQSGVTYYINFWAKKISGSGSLSADWADGTPQVSWADQLVTGEWVKVEVSGTSNIASKNFLDVIGNTDHNYTIDFYDVRIEARDVTGSVVGQTVYVTGSEKKHLASDKVRKMATLTTSSSSNGTNTITVANANKFTAGDDIWIEHRSEADGSTDYEGWYDGNHDESFYTISSVNGNTITLSSNLTMNVVNGALVSRLSRDVVVTTVATDGSDYGFFYSEFYSSNWNKKLILKDVYFKNVGNDDSNVYQGCVIRGYHSTDSLPVTLTETVPSRGREPWIEGVVVHNFPEDTHKRDWGSLWLYDARYATARCCQSIYGDEGIAAHYEPGQSVYNCISTNAREWGFRLEGSNEWYEFAYLYSSRNRYGIRLVSPYEAGLGTHSIITDAHIYSVNLSGGDTGLQYYRFKCTGHLSGAFHGDRGNQNFVYSTFKSVSGNPNSEAETGTRQDGIYYHHQVTRGHGSRPIVCAEYDFEYDKMWFAGAYSEGIYDNDEQAWRFFRGYNTSQNPGLFERIFIPAGVTVRVSLKTKMSPSFNGTYPYLVATDVISNVGSNRLDNNATNAARPTGIRMQNQFTSASDNAFEEKQITIEAKSWPRQFIIGVWSTSSNASEGFWVKDLQIFVDKAYAPHVLSSMNNIGVLTPTVKTLVSDSFDRPKKRIGGRLA